MTDIQQFLDEALDRIQHKQVEAFNKAVIAYFGSVEEAYAQRDNYVIEEYPPEIDMSMLTSNNMSMKSTVTFRIRRKTDEELAQHTV